MQGLPTGTQMESPIPTGVERLARRFRRNTDGTLKRSTGLSLEGLILLVVSAVCLLPGVHRVAGGGEASLAEAIAEIDRLGGRSTIDEEGLKVVLDSTQATDASSERLKALTHLQVLVLDRTPITDAGLSHLRGLSRLRKLYLRSTSVTDAGLEHLKGLSQLTTMDLTNTHVTGAALERFRGLTQLQTLNLGGARVTDAGLEALKGLTQLQELDLSYSAVRDRGLEHLKGLIHLRTLNLGDTQITDAGLEHLRGLVQLTTLGFAHTKVGDAGLEHLKGLTQLQTLDLYCTKVTDAGLEHLRGFTQLRGLELTLTSVTDIGMEHLKDWPRLQTLVLRGTKITDAGLEHLGRLTDLQNLDLGNTQVTDAVCRRLQQLTRLQTLELRNTKITDSGLVQLKGLTELRSLGIGGTGITSAGLEHLKPLTHLQKLEIWNTKVTDVGLEHLTGLPELRALYLARSLVTDAASVHLKRMPRLRTLDVSETEVTEAGVTELEKALPKLGIANLRGTEAKPKAPQPSVEPISVPAGQKQQDSDNQTERAVTDALDWLARHQSADGRWTLDKYATACTDETCSGPGMQNADTAATALGLLPFLAAGQTHKSNGPHRRAVMRGLAWLMQNQKPDGDLRGGANMYAHGLATIAVCEAYGLTGDRAVGSAAQAAINFLEAAQNQATGGWRYVPGEAGDTSVLGWQLQALHSGRMAGLKVAPAALEGADKWIKSVALGKRGGLSQYTPEVSSPTPTMTAVALLSRQFLGSKPTEPAVVEGRQYLMANLPGRSGRNAYYWFYGTQAFKHVGGPDWDAWKRSVSQKLLESQCHDGCAAGSWSARKPVQDAWGQQGGRVMVTSLSALTLQVESGNLLLFKLDSKLARKAESK